MYPTRVKELVLMYQSSPGIGTCGYISSPQLDLLRKCDVFESALQLLRMWKLIVVILCNRYKFMSGSSVKVFHRMDYFTTFKNYLFRVNVCLNFWILEKKTICLTTQNYTKYACFISKQSPKQMMATIVCACD